ncbi:MAG: hypothetical protein P4L86_22860 [Mycobacterium sp.]|nr:hypothetical protein [Mycobacterium sp.]
MHDEPQLPEIPESFFFGDGIDWASDVAETRLYVELPFWLMTPPGPVVVNYQGTDFTVDICSPWMEVFAWEVTDSHVTAIHQGPINEGGWRPSPQMAEELAQDGASFLMRRCKTVLRIVTQAHTDPFRELPDNSIPRRYAEQEAYRASLCEAHIPVINELIQCYRLDTYDYFPHEVDAWDVPIWYVSQDGSHHAAALLRYKEWDDKPVLIERDGTQRQFAFTNPEVISDTSTSDATPGEFDLLDARSLMERGDYTGAVRRTVTAVEAVLRWALKNELGKQYDEAEAERRTANTDNDFPGRLAQWRKLARPDISDALFDEFARTRRLRHDIVHCALRLTFEDRGKAQRAVDTSRWLYNKIEGKPSREHLREFGGGGLARAVGRAAMAPRFPSCVTDGRITLTSPEPDWPEPDQDEKPPR